MHPGNPDSDAFDDDAGLGKVISQFRREAAHNTGALQTAIRDSANFSGAGEARLCPHCHQSHEEYYLCDELMLVHGLPCKCAGSFTPERPQLERFSEERIRDIAACYFNDANDSAICCSAIRAALAESSNSSRR